MGIVGLSLTGDTGDTPDQWILQNIEIRSNLLTAVAWRCLRRKRRCPGLGQMMSDGRQCSSLLVFQSQGVDYRRLNWSNTRNRSNTPLPMDERKTPHCSVVLKRERPWTLRNSMWNFFRQMTDLLGASICHIVSLQCFFDGCFQPFWNELPSRSAETQSRH